MSVTQNYQVSGGSGLPSGGNAGQFLISDGAGGGKWARGSDPSSGLQWAVGDTVSTGRRGLGVISSSTTAYGANQLVLSPFYAPEPLTVSELGINVTVAGGNARLGVFTYDIDAGTLTLVADAGAVATNTVAYKNITGLSIALSPGWFMVGVVFDVPCTITNYTPAYSFGDTTAFAAWAALQVPTVPYGAFAASYTGLTNGNFPLPQFLLRRGS